MAYSIVYLPASTADLNAMLEYIQPHNSAAANTLLDTLESRIGELKNFPQLGKIVPDYELTAKGYRFLVVENYYVFYIVHEEEKAVKIYRILSAQQDYLKWLK
ncbi:MAG: type II toxin-antitoxin system RelE/ParE family toxin [Veillonellales bacterium]